MPNQRLERTRASLPEGYQFGDARYYHTHLWRPAPEFNGSICHCGAEKWPDGPWNA